MFAILRKLFGFGKSSNDSASNPRLKKEKASVGEAGASSSSFLAAKVLHILDGDSVEVLLGRDRVRIRLDSIDCPEDGQEWGHTATAGLIKLIGGRTVIVEEHGVDSHGRLLATLYLRRSGVEEWVNVNERMVMLGHAWVMRHYYKHLPQDRRNSLNRIERWARSKRVGLWSTSNPQPPWSYRKQLEQFE